MLISPGADTKVESEKIWAATEDLKLPRIAFVSRLDRERTNFDAALKDLEKVLGARAVALTIPIGEELGFNGVIDVLAMKALTYADATGKLKEEELIRRPEDPGRGGAHRAVRGGRRDRRRAAGKISRQGHARRRRSSHRAACGRSRSQNHAGVMRLGREEYRHRAAARRCHDAICPRPTSARRWKARIPRMASRSAVPPIPRRRSQRWCSRR